jgi:preprotein translocase subunit SecF
MRHALTFNVISAVTFVLAVFFLATRGLNLGVDSAAAPSSKWTYDHAADFERIRDIVDKNISGEASVQSFGTSTTALIRLPLKDDYSNSPINACLTEKAAQNRTEGKPAAVSSAANLSNCLMVALQADDATARQQRVEFVGPQVGKELFENGALALLSCRSASWATSLRFEWRFAVAAIIANLHDIIIILGFLRCSSGNSRCRCSPPSSPCWAIRSTSRW